ncbi:hypothetical protein EJ04DRAFT_416277, partial [Polyplosphaeria fusca]
NLFAALRHLRNAKESRSLWIDAICINQSDVIEREIEIKRMGDISRLAHRVVAWIGLADDSSASAFENLRRHGTQIKYTEDCTFILAMQQLLELAWFNRLWVQQELQLSNHRTSIQCGKDSIPVSSMT